MLRWGKLELSGGFLLISAALFYCDTENILPWAALAGGLHELGHYCAVRLLGGQIMHVRLSAVGGEMTLDRRRPLSYWRELVTVLAGPWVNLALAFLCVRLGRGEAAWLFAGLNLALGAFNLLPIYPLDGGRALLLVLTIFCSEELALELVRLCATLCVGILLAAGSAVFLHSGRSFSLLVMALWLLAGLLGRPGASAEKWRHSP